MRVLQALVLVGLLAIAHARPGPEGVSLHVEPHDQPSLAVEPAVEHKPAIQPPQTEGATANPLTYPAVDPAPIPAASDVDSVLVVPAKETEASHVKEGPSIDLEQVHSVTDRNEPKPWCPKLYLPVCASNGKTYNTECELNIAIRSDGTLSKAKDGACE